MSKLDTFKKECDIAYDNGRSLISDAQYDNLFGESATIGRIGYSDDITHMYPLYSLQKYYVEDGTTPLNLEDCNETPKLDGVAICLLYVDNTLVRATTRGDGVKGKDVTDKIKHIVPNELKFSLYESTMQIIGELVSSKFIDNSRNQTAGLMTLKDMEIFKQRVKELDTKFVAYGVSTPTFIYYKQDMQLLADNGFSTVFNNCEAFPTDGLVYRLKDNNKFIEAGYTSKHPKGAFAWKTKQVPVVTTLLDVEWQVGKSGKVTPVAILDPVEIDGATIQRATLNNMAFIEGLDLVIGCEVELIRAGEIIPEIISRVFD